MKKRACLLVLVALISSSCVLFPKWDAAGHFNDLGIPNRVDTLDVEQGFDSIVVFRLKVVDRSPRPLEEPGSHDRLKVYLRLTDAYINSDPATKEKVYWDGDPARYFPCIVDGEWNRKDEGNTFEGYSVSEVRSKLGQVIFDKVHLSTGMESGLDIEIYREFTILPGKINYLGTISISIENTGRYSGKVVKQAYTQYDTKITEGDIYNTAWSKTLSEEDLRKDLDEFAASYPNLWKRFEEAFHFVKFD